MVMHVGNRWRVSRVTRPAGPPARLGNRPTPVNDCPQDDRQLKQLSRLARPVGRLTLAQREAGNLEIGTKI